MAADDLAAPLGVRHLALIAEELQKVADRH
jgi:hypothetical protein